MKKLVISILIAVTILILESATAQLLHAEVRTTLSESDSYSVQLIIEDWKLGLEVIGPSGKVLWKTQPYSSSINVSLDEKRIVIFKKERNPGFMDEHRPYPRSGAVLFTLDGTRIKEIDDPIYRGSIVSTQLLGKMEGGHIVAYQLENGKELWRKNIKAADFYAIVGPGIINIRGVMYKGSKKEWTNQVLNMLSGETLFIHESPMREYTDILAASTDRILLQKLIEGGTQGYITEIIDYSGKRTAKIEPSGFPQHARFSNNGERLAIVSIKEGIDTKSAYILEVYRKDGTKIQEELILGFDGAKRFDASIIFDSDAVQTILTRKNKTSIGSHK